MILSLPETYPLFAVTASQSTQLLSVTFNNALPYANEASGALVVTLGTPQLGSGRLQRPMAIRRENSRLHASAAYRPKDHSCPIRYLQRPKNLGLSEGSQSGWPPEQSISL